MKSILFYIFFFISSLLYSQQVVELCENNQNTFTYTSTTGLNGTYVWSINNVDYITNELTYTWETPGDYQIILTFTSIGGCQDSISYNVTVVECQESVLWFPNSFTPNGNGINENWSPTGFNYTNLEYYVFDRWGEQIYKSDSELKPWDGTYKGNECQQDVYVFIARWRDNSGTIQSAVGHISLIR